MKIKDKICIIPRTLLEDSRGYLLKVINGSEDHLPSKMGEIYVTMAKPNESRGGHYHAKATEWFTLIQGEAILLLCDVKNNEKHSIYLNSLSPRTVMIPPYVAHKFVNNSKTEFVLIAYSGIIYEPSDTIEFNFD